MQVDFYHLAASPPERVIARIAEKILGDGGRLLVVTADDAQAAALDAALWSIAPESFLPHGRADLLVQPRVLVRVFGNELRV